jgi:hypothetical protein
MFTLDTARSKIREITNTSANNYSDESLLRDLNAEILSIQIMILRDRGTLEFDDPGYTNLPVATFNIVSGQRSYKITEDEDSNRILTKHKIMIDGVDIPRIKVGEGNQQALKEDQLVERPRGYFEVGDNIVFQGTPSKSTTATVWFDREVTQLETGDGAEPLPLPYAYHQLACYQTAFNYALDKGLRNEDRILRRLQREEEKLEQYEMNRRSDEATVMHVWSIDDGLQ